MVREYRWYQKFIISRILRKRKKRLISVKLKFGYWWLERDSLKLTLDSLVKLKYWNWKIFRGKEYSLNQKFSKIFRILRKKIVVSVKLKTEYWWFQKILWSSRRCKQMKRRADNQNDLLITRRYPRSVMVKALDSWIVVSKFELQLRHHAHFRTNIHGKVMNCLIFLAMV